MKALRYILPLLLFIVLVVFLYIGLSRDPREVPSPLIGKAAPLFNLAQVTQPQLNLTPAELKGQAWLLNVWASWCVSCRIEHPLLLRLAKEKTIPLYGLNWKDQTRDALAWLAQYGDPYIASAADQDGRVAIDYGVYGAPETFLIDRNGIIRYKHIGPLNEQVWREKMLPLIRELNR